MVMVIIIFNSWHQHNQPAQAHHRCLSILSTIGSIKVERHTTTRRRKYRRYRQSLLHHHLLLRPIPHCIIRNNSKRPLTSCWRYPNNNKNYNKMKTSTILKRKRYHHLKTIVCHVRSLRLYIHMGASIASTSTKKCAV